MNYYKSFIILFIIFIFIKIEVKLIIREVYKIYILVVIKKR